MTDQRGSIFLEDATVIEHIAHEGEQFILTVEAPDIARRAAPGSFAHIQCDPDIAMRRPLSIMQADPERGTVEFLYKTVGVGLRSLSALQAGHRLSVLGPIGNGFSPDPARSHKLLLGGGVGIPPIRFLAEQLRAQDFDMSRLLVLMGSEVPFPFPVEPSAIEVAGVSSAATHSLAGLEALGIPARLASLKGYAGCHTGYVTDLGRDWLAALPEADRQQTELFACGPEPMLAAAAKLAQEFGLPCQLCLEEFMACAVGGCAGCTVPVHLPDGLAMKRVCVDGPVFAADTIYPA